MKTLKNKFDNYSSDDFGHNTTPELDEVIEKVNKDVKESIQDYKLYLEMKCCYIASEGFKKIFGDWEK